MAGPLKGKGPPGADRAGLSRTSSLGGADNSEDGPFPHREQAEGSVDADRLRRHVLVELHHAWLRLERAQTELQWARAALGAGTISPEAALEILEGEFMRLEGIEP